MNDTVLHTLEFDKIRRLLSAHATSAPGRSLCEQLKPCADLSDAKRALQETSDAMARIGEKGGISFGSLYDLSPQLSQLAIGGTLDASQLLRMASFLENASRVRAYGEGSVKAEGEEKKDSLRDFFLGLSALPVVVAEIRRCIISEEEISSEASTQLKAIRREYGLTSSRIREVLNKMVSGSHRTYLQDGVVTMRGDRYCLPVKAEHKGQIPGIVHDRSSSGSTLFIEPAQVVELNNRLRELSLEEEKEIARILAELSASLSDHTEAIRDNAAIMTHLDFVFAKAQYAFETDAARPAFSEDDSLSLLQARHPLIDKDKVVATDIRIGKEHGYRMLVITGPNTGGKTVTIKTAGLLTLMGMAGLCIPADPHSKIAFFREIHADIGDEQSIEQSLSTFSAHMTNIVRMLREAKSHDLCLFDELGAGTDPTEGAALAIAILHHLLNEGATVLATTHYAELKVFAMTTKDVNNASCEFDVATLRPTYRLLTGTPGMSNAFAISRKLGLPEEIISAAHAQIDTDKARMETLFADLEESRKTIEAEREEIERYREETKALNEKLEEQARSFDALGEDILQEARAEAERILKEAKTFADDTIRVMRKEGADEAMLAVLERERTRLNQRIAKNAGEQKGDAGRPSQQDKSSLKETDIRKGMSVRIVSMNLQGHVETLPDKDGHLMVRCGIMQVEALLSDLAEGKEEEQASGKEIAKRFSMKRAFEQAPSAGKKQLSRTPDSAYVSAEVNLIGKNTDDALSILDKYLDDAYRAHMPSVRIVHGKGTGTLRSAVQRHLKQVSYVKSFQNGEYGEGDAGVTIATFR